MTDKQKEPDFIRVEDGVALFTNLDMKLPESHEKVKAALTPEQYEMFFPKEIK